MEKIIVIGSPGAGKSSFSKKLKNITKLPLYHIDMLYHKKDGTHITKEELEEKLKEIFKTDKWIIDGNYSKTLKERFDRADLIIWLDYSTYAQVKGIFNRILKNYGKEKTEIPGCKERFNFTFFKYVITYNKKKRHIIVDSLNGIPEDKVLIFKKRKALNKWLEELR